MDDRATSLPSKAPDDDFSNSAGTVAPRSSSPYLSELRLENFGRFHDQNIGPFKPGLNVVFGPNEAGKSTITSFIRQMFYGWERRRKSTNTFKPKSGDCCGSIFFRSDVGEWELYRAKGNKGVTVTRHEGAAWPTAFDDIREGVAEDTYRSVFSFNAEELMMLPTDSGSMSAKLLTAGSGTDVAPTNVYDAIEQEIKDLGSRQGGRQHAVGTLKQNLDDVNRELDDLSQQALGYADKSIELEQLQHEQDVRTQQLDELHARASQLNSDRALAGEWAESLSRQQQHSRELADTLDELREQEKSLRLSEEDQRLVDHAADIERAFQSREDLRRRLEEFERRDSEIENAISESGDCEDHGGATGRVLRNEMDDRRVEAYALAEKTRSAREALDQAVAEERAAEEGVARFEESKESLHTEPKRNLILSGRVLVAIGCVAFICAIAFAAAISTVVEPYIVGGSGVVLAVVGVILWLMGRPSPDVDEIERRRKAANELLDRARNAQGLARGTYSTALENEQSFANETAEFLEQNGYGEAGSDLKLALELYDEQVRYNQLNSLVTMLQEKREQAKRDFNDLLGKVRTALRPADPDVDKVLPDNIIQHMDDLKNRLARSRENMRQHEAAVEKLGQAETARAQVNASINEVLARLGELATKNGADPDGDVPAALEGVAQKMQEQISALSQERSAADSRKGSLEAELRAGARETRLQDMRLRREELKAQLARSAQRYVELLCAQKIMQSSIEIWEQERQPEVYRIASELFSEMTDGAWLKVGSEGRELFVKDASHRVQPTSILSTGTTQQLYLSLRIALLLVADDTGRSLPVVADDILVSFDASRREGAARALRRLAEQRQVIIFTCHRDVQHLLESQGGDVNSFDLPA
jgi:DNA repair exonuclease SbcCD ATPase subunit